MKYAIGLLMILLICGPSLLAQPRFRNAGAYLIAEQMANRAVEFGEQVTVRLALKNVGDEVASNLLATIQTGDGVSSPVPQTHVYGTLTPGGPSVAREFSFTCTAPSNSLMAVNLQLTDSGRALGTAAFKFRVWPQSTYASNVLTININPIGPAEMYPSVLTVTNAIGAINNVSVTLSNLSHTFPDDLDILLVSPSGDTVLLMSDACGNVDLDHMTLTFSDDADAVLPDFGFPTEREVRPTNHGSEDTFPVPAPAGPYAGVLSAFNGKEANGDWKLYIFDDGSGDFGALYGGWSLTITTIQAIDTAPGLTFLGRTNEMIRFAISGRPGRNYTVETSPDPLQSTTLEHFQMPATGVRVFEYPLGPENRFFRAATDP